MATVPGILSTGDPRVGAPPQRTDETFRQFYDRTRDEPVYLILGVQGSGTNLLGRLLARLFNFSLVRDRSAVFRSAVRLGATPTPADVARELRSLRPILQPSALRRKTRKDVIRDEKLAGLVPELESAPIRNGAELARLVYAYRAYRTGTTRMAVKSDDLWEHLDAIDQVMPNRRVILLTRDFRDNALSICGKAFGPVEPLCAALYVKRQLAHYAAEYRRAGARGYHATFEQLLNQTRSFADDFAARFDLAPSVDLDAAIPLLRFRPNKIGKWNRLTARELAWCEGLLQQELLDFGYAPASSAPEVPGAGPLFAARARDAVKRVPQKLRRIAARLGN